MSKSRKVAKSEAREKKEKKAHRETVSEYNAKSLFE